MLDNKERNKNVVGYEVRVKYDMYTDSPREWDNIFTIDIFGNYSYQERYKTENDLLIGLSINNEMSMNEVEDVEDFILYEGYDNNEEFIEVAEGNGYIIYPIYVYEHSGIKYSIYPFSCKWDSGLVGYAYVKKDEFIKEVGMSKVSDEKLKEKASEIIENELDTYTEYVNGNVYIVYLYEKVKCNCCDSVTSNYIDSIGGIYNTEHKSFDELAKEIIYDYLVVDNLDENEKEMLDKAIEETDLVL